MADSSHIEVTHFGGIGVLPMVHHPAPGDSSAGPKIISDELIRKKYVVKVEGLSGTEGKIRLIKSGKVIEHEFTFPQSTEKYVQMVLVLAGADERE